MVGKDRDTKPALVARNSSDLSAARCSVKGGRAGLPGVRQRGSGHTLSVQAQALCALNGEVGTAIGHDRCDGANVQERVLCRDSDRHSRSRSPKYFSILQAGVHSTSAQTCTQQQDETLTGSRVYPDA